MVQSLRGNRACALRHFQVASGRTGPHDIRACHRASAHSWRTHSSDCRALRNRVTPLGQPETWKSQVKPQGAWKTAPIGPIKPLNCQDGAQATTSDVFREIENHHHRLSHYSDRNSVRIYEVNGGLSVAQRMHIPVLFDTAKRKHG